MQLTASRRFLLGLSLLVSGCAAPRPGPYALVLGTAQDAGLPQIGCRQDCCERARQDRSRERLVASLLLVDPESGQRWLIDASPDLKRQVELARQHPPGRPPGPGRPPLFEGVFLTHAHMGHYTGLFDLGNEAYGARNLPLHVTRKMAGFLEHNDPWRWMIREGFLELNIVEYDTPVRLTDELSVTAIPVPHRDEFSDTVAYLIEGPRRSLLYLPDIDKWQRFELPIELLVEQVDVAFLDGTFYDSGEIPGRAMDEIPHPFIQESIERFANLPRAQRGKVVFTHLNHTNPAADPDSAASIRLRRAGFSVAREGQQEQL